MFEEKEGRGWRFPTRADVTHATIPSLATGVPLLDFRESAILAPSSTRVGVFDATTAVFISDTPFPCVYSLHFTRGSPMDGSTFRSRLGTLMQRSRRAMRLYEGVTGGQGGAFAETQAREWRYANCELLKGLASALEKSSPRELLVDVLSLRRSFESEQCSVEVEISQKGVDLQSASKCGDFIKAALLSTELVSLKARSQALHAVQHELELVLKQSKASVKSEEAPPLLGRMPENVIPLRLGRF